ncbi:SGNH hydrolase domain-containing protein [Homoserinimonas sp. OAct 916]|uniref:SGNH hydrolase domain-containing protein n=1 Tax=Homoserinimonas sp. OAct 916 TaxID=2211450 RepID=UPI0034CF4F67
MIATCGLVIDGAPAFPELFLDRAPLLDEVELPDRTAFVDLSDSFCSESTCEADVGNILAYRDDDHMTATYSKTPAPALRAQFKEQASWLF